MAAAIAAGEATPESLLAEAERALHAADSAPLPLHPFLSSRFTRPTAPLPDGPLRGIPFAAKDNLCTLDLPTTCGSRILEGYRSPFEATVIRRLREAGAILVGKTNLDEFAMGSSTEHSAFGPTRNPHDRSRVPGGSSGGSAAAVAAGIVPLALGSETGGSVRQPAAFCGVVGLKPTYGRISRYGLVAFASSLDQVGILTRTVEDAALALEVLSSVDPRDATSAAPPLSPGDSGGPTDLGGLVVGVPEEYFPEEMSAPAREACRRALREMEGFGAEIRELRLPHTPVALPAYHVLANAEAASNLARFDGIRFGARAPDAAGSDDLYERTRALFGREVKRRILLGTHVLTGVREGHYDSALRARDGVRQDFMHAFGSGIDLIFTPTTPTPAFLLGELLSDPWGMYLSDAFTVAANLAGLPALSLPIGAAGQLPLGGQLIAPRWKEDRLLRVAGALQAALGRSGEGRR